VANANSRHAAHAYERTFEAFASSSAVNVFWRDTEEESQSEAGPAIVIVSPPFCHDVAPSGTTYVFRVSRDAGGTTDDDVTPCTGPG
jgi:hypothetical protein